MIINNTTSYKCRFLYKINYFIIKYYYKVFLNENILYKIKRPKTDDAYANPQSLGFRKLSKRYSKLTNNKFAQKFFHYWNNCYFSTYVKECPLCLFGVNSETTQPIFMKLASIDSTRLVKRHKLLQTTLFFEIIPLNG